jgi:hypothetical protein
MTFNKQMSIIKRFNVHMMEIGKSFIEEFLQTNSLMVSLENDNSLHYTG